MEQEIVINGLKIIYEETGNPEGAPVILIHGWGCDHSTVKSIAACLNDGLRIISLDLPGHGKSDEPEAVWGTSDFADFVGKFVKKLGILNPSFIGHSFGGRTSIYYASRNPVNKLILVDSAGVRPKRSLKYYYKVYSYKTLKKIALLVLGEEKSKRWIEKSLKRKGSADYQAASPKMRAIMSKCINEDLKNIMNRINAPTLLIWGENDTATPVSDAKIMEKLIPDAGLVSFKDCGHYSFLDNPIGFKAVVREFFKPEIQKSQQYKNSKDV